MHRVPTNMQKLRKRERGVAYHTGVLGRLSLLCATSPVILRNRHQVYRFNLKITGVISSQILHFMCLISWAKLALRRPSLNPITAPACKISGLKDARTRLKNSIFSGPITHLLSMLCVVIKVLSHASAKRKQNGLKGFKFPTFIGHFQATSWH